MSKWPFQFLRKILPAKARQRLDYLRQGYIMVSHPDSYLVKTGFLESRIKMNSVDESGQGIPWINYAVIHFLKEKLKNKRLRIFEYGAGASTVFFSQYAKQLISVEHDEKWIETIGPELKKMSNVELMYRSIGPEYAHSIEHAGMQEKFDLVIIDGRIREECTKVALGFVKEAGVILFDDSDWPKFQHPQQLIMEQGFNRLPFQGLKPTGLGIEESTLYYRPGNNCLGI